ncbi:general transcription factor 3C polypeptide 6 [Hyla sarda]|uniref:general transcription factor 3C polypeptide 6 n=1 Tax=Hyla sarda TaxID=327740 RepID=UPI0024C35625|nr:general transcription factor 3C polypeptide 6 [Hyla sarda]XP_056429062.1 general transcription factor 3C polypeptide 6 [Hyla sarda]
MASNIIPASSGQKTSAVNKCMPDEEEEEEEQLVLVELTGIIDSDILEKCDNKCKILGINTEKPFLQVDKYVFAGEYEDALGTCVIFEEVPDPGDGESTNPKLKYKCHTVKKLNMTRTFLTEKKEGDEGGGKIEWFQIKDDTSASWPQMICSFAQENEDATESQSEEDDHGQLDTSIEEAGQVDQSFYLEGKQHSCDVEKGPSESEARRHLDSDKEESNTSNLIFEAEHGTHPVDDVGSLQQDDIVHHDQTS